jgi:hypothetical protein
MEENVIILYAAEYSITDDKTGRTNEGVSISYLMSDSLEPVSDVRTKGFRVMKGTLPLSAAVDVEDVPGLYAVKFTIKPDASGKPTLRPSQLRFVNTI